MMFNVPSLGFCKEANKYKQTQKLADLVADKMALIAWKNGNNSSFSSYHCQHCGTWHVGHDRQVQKIEEGKVSVPMHRYKYLCPPMAKIPKRYFTERN